MVSEPVETVLAIDEPDMVPKTLHAEHPTFTHTETAFAEMGARLNVRFVTVYFIPMFTYIERGLAYAVVDPMSAESYKPFSGGKSRIVFRPFRPTVHLIASIMTPKHRPLSKLAQSFHVLLRDEVHRIRQAYSEGVVRVMKPISATSKSVDIKPQVDATLSRQQSDGA